MHQRHPHIHRRRLHQRLNHHQRRKLRFHPHTQYLLRRQFQRREEEVVFRSMDFEEQEQMDEKEETEEEQVRFVTAGAVAFVCICRLDRVKCRRRIRMLRIERRLGDRRSCSMCYGNLLI